MSHKETYMAWLRDAYGMEVSLIEVLERRVDDAEGHPVVQSKVKEHLEETRRHAELIESRIHHLGEDTSSIKSGMSKLVGMFQGIATRSSNDVLVKNVLADYASEHFEIAAYTALVIAAEDLGDAETAQICRQILKDEERMAKFLEENLPTAVRDTIREAAASHD